MCYDLTSIFCLILSIVFNHYFAHNFRDIAQRSSYNNKRTVTWRVKISDEQYLANGTVTSFTHVPAYGANSYLYSCFVARNPDQAARKRMRQLLFPRRSTPAQVA